MKLELTRFEATDGVRLAGLLYEPERGQTDQAALFLHGNGDSSIFTSSKRTNALGEALCRRSIAFFPFDNRGAHLVRWLKRKTGDETEPYDGGMAHERIADCVHDIDGALRLLRAKGFARFHLIGHSTGANKICIYHNRKPRNRVTSYVLLAPGDDTGRYYENLGPRRFAAAIEKCRKAIRDGRAHRFAPRTLSPFPISYESLLDTIDPDGDYNVFPFTDAIHDLGLSRRKPLFDEFRSITKPTLLVYGSEDEYAIGGVDRCVAILRENAKHPRRFSAEIISGTDHGFHGAEHDLGRRIATWLAD